LPEADLFASPASRDVGDRDLAIYFVSEFRPARQSVELRGAEGKVIRMSGSKRGEQLDGREGRIVR
jgi:hypothetical protein